MGKANIELRMSGGINNLNTPLDLFLRKKGEVQSLVNADTSYPGQFRRLLPLTALNSAAGTALHSLFVANGIAFVVDGTTLKYNLNGTLTTLASGLSGNRVSFEKVGNWVFLVDGTAKKAIYTPTLAVCDWGVAIPGTAPTVANSGSGGNPSGTYSCYYRYKITLPDAVGTIVRTALSPVGSVTLTSKKISWSGLVHSAFAGATTAEIELFRTKTGWAYTYLVDTIAYGTTTYTDDSTDAALQASTTYDEEGYYPPPDAPTLLKYYTPADRMVCVVNGDAFWSEAGLYHTFMYSASADDYESVNSVFLAGEDITAVKIIDENMYFASIGTWRRLRGRTPSQWQWEDTSAITGTLNNVGAVDTPFGILGPGIDGRLWLFSGLSSRPVIEEFVFPAKPVAATCHGTYDGRFYRLFYADPTNPELVIDLHRYPASAGIAQSTRTATASFHDRITGKVYYCDDGYLYQGENAGAGVTMSFMTGEIPAEDLSILGNMGMLIIRANTQGDNLVITPYIDGVAQTALTPVVTSTLLRKEVPVRFGDGRTLSFGASITSSKAIIIEEPWVLRKE